MYLFIYGTMRKGEGDSYYSDPAALVKERVWTNAVLVDTGKEFAALAPGNKRVTGELYFVEEQLNVIKGLIEHYNTLNPLHKFFLRPITVFTDKEEIKASAFMYDTSKGLDVIVTVIGFFIKKT